MSEGIKNKIAIELRESFNKTLTLAGFDPNQKRAKDGEWTKQGSTSLRDKPCFKKWFGDSKVVDEDGEPLEVYHGTTHEFNEFTKERGNIENDMGKGYYFSTSEDDAMHNYNSVNGADLTGRIERLAERLEYDLEITYDEAKAKATSRLSGGENRLISAFISMSNPIYIGGENDTYLDFDSGYDEETDEYGEESGLLVDFFTNYAYASAGFYDVDSNAVFEGIEIYEGMYAGDFVKAIRRNESVLYATDDDGNLVSNEILRRTFEMMGFDGVVDSTVSRFNMDGIYNDTKHIIAFKPNQIKSSDAESFCHESNINLSKNKK